MSTPSTSSPMWINLALPAYTEHMHSKKEPLVWKHTDLQHISVRDKEDEFNSESSTGALLYLCLTHTQTELINIHAAPADNLVGQWGRLSSACCNQKAACPFTPWAVARFKGLFLWKCNYFINVVFSFLLVWRCPSLFDAQCRSHNTDAGA